MEELRAAFPVCATRAYLNAGTCGPTPAVAAQAAARAAQDALRDGRAAAYYGALVQRREELRAAYARVLDARPDDVALTTGTSEAMVKVLLGLDLRPGDEVVTADDEHPGLLGPLAAARERLGIAVRAVPFAAVPEAVGPRTRLVAVSHVSWMTGSVVGPLRDLGIPVLLDGAQGAGAIDVDLEELGATFYAAAGQKWLCGPVGTGLLWIDPSWSERLAATGPTYVALADTQDPLAGRLKDGAARHDTPATSLEAVEEALAALGVLEDAGWPAVRARAVALADRLTAELRAQGHELRGRDATTLVAWRAGDAEARAAQLAEQGIVLRWLPGGTDLRASVGAWNDERDLERLLDALQSAGAPATMRSVSRASASEG
jgi:L-cysteine/cystine lyase